MEYRLIRENEIDTVIKLIDKVVKECVCLDFEIERKSDFYLNKYSLTYVCLDDNKIVGMVSLTNGNYLNLLFVDKEYRRRGIGKKLVEIIDNLVLEDLEVNVGAYAKSFFEHIGFSLKVDFEKKDTYSMIKKRYVEKKFSNYDEVVEFINGQKDRVYSLGIIWRI